MYTLFKDTTSYAHIKKYFIQELCIWMCGRSPYGTASIINHKTTGTLPSNKLRPSTTEITSQYKSRRAGDAVPAAPPAGLYGCFCAQQWRAETLTLHTTPFTFIQRNTADSIQVGLNRQHVWQSVVLTVFRWGTCSRGYWSQSLSQDLKHKLTLSTNIFC